MSSTAPGALSPEIPLIADPRSESHLPWFLATGPGGAACSLFIRLCGDELPSELAQVTCQEVWLW
jgi:hypothetical protein